MTNLMPTTTYHLSSLPSVSPRPWFRWWPHLLLAGLAILSFALLFSPTLTLSWQYDRTAIENGQWWRLLTGHLTHWNLDHWVWDWTTFVALSLVGLRQAPSRTGLTVLGAAVLISCSAWCLLPDLQYYRGLSGLDTALFTLLATEMLVKAIRERQYRLASLVLVCAVGLLVKTGFELLTGSTLFVDSAAAGFETITLAHGVGALVGIWMANDHPSIYGVMDRNCPQNRKISAAAGEPKCRHGGPWVCPYP